MIKLNKCKLPSHSLIYKTQSHYVDAYEGFISNDDVTIELATMAFFQSAPKWIASLFRLRNYIVKNLGLKVTNVNDNLLDIKEDEIEPGRSIGLFTIKEKCQMEIIIGEDDKHLNFRVSILIMEQENGYKIIISTTVYFHNNFGKVYFYIIRPFHKIVVKTMLRNIIKTLT